MKKMNNKGMSLIELVVASAIMVVLVGTLSTVFTPYIEKAKEAKDIANVDNAVKELKLAAIGNGIATDGTETLEKTVTLCQSKEGWTTTMDTLSISGILFTDYEWEGSPEPNGTCRVYYKDQEIHIDWGGSVDYSVPGNVAKRVSTELEKKMSETPNIYGKVNGTVTETLTLPNGKTVTTIVYNRDYDYFQDIKTRLTTPNTASAIYNRETGKISTIVYYDGKKYVEWKLVDGKWEQGKEKNK